MAEPEIWTDKIWSRTSLREQLAESDSVDWEEDPQYASLGLNGGLFVPAHLARLVTCACGDQFISKAAFDAHARGCPENTKQESKQQGENNAQSRRADPSQQDSGAATARPRGGRRQRRLHPGRATP